MCSGIWEVIPWWVLHESLCVNFPVCCQPIASIYQACLRFCNTLIRLCYPQSPFLWGRGLPGRLLHHAFQGISGKNVICPRCPRCLGRQCAAPVHQLSCLVSNTVRGPQSTSQSCTPHSGYEPPRKHTLFSLFTSHVIKTKNCNHSVNKVKSLEYDRWLINKQPCQELVHCWFSFACYLEKCFTKIYRALYGDAMLVSLGGAQTWQP